MTPAFFTTHDEHNCPQTPSGVCMFAIRRSVETLEWQCHKHDVKRNRTKVLEMEFYFYLIRRTRRDYYARKAVIDKIDVKGWC